MGRHNRKRAERLRLMVDCLPYETRVAMLDGIARYEIIAGAYSARGGVCPMLAAHRCGGRTDFRGFARAWDRFTGARRRARKASQRELRTLISQLEASIWNEGQVLELRKEAERIARERRAKDRAASAAAKPAAQVGRADSRPGPGGDEALSPAWLVAVRSLDDYRRALEAARRQVEERSPQGEPARSPGRTIITSGTTHAGESRSRQRTTSATS